MLISIIANVAGCRAGAFRNSGAGLKAGWPLLDEGGSTAIGIAVNVVWQS